MAWDEVLRMTTALSVDPASCVGAALAGWDYPLSRESIALVGLYNLQGRSKYGRKHVDFPVPWRTARRKFGTAVSRDRWEQIRSELEAG